MTHLAGFFNNWIVLFFEIFHYLDTIVITHNKIVDLVSSLGKNKYNNVFNFANMFISLS